MSRGLTKRHQRYLCRMQQHLLEAARLPDPIRTQMLRTTARHCLHAGLRELARTARQMARVGGAT